MKSDVQLHSALLPIDEQKIKMTVFLKYIKFHQD